MYSPRRNCVIATCLLLLVLKGACAAGKCDKCRIVIVQSDKMIPRIVDKTWRIDFAGAKQIMLSDAIIYFSPTPGNTLNAGKWFGELVKLFPPEEVNSDGGDYERLRRKIASDVGLVILLANPSEMVTHLFTWENWNSYMIRTTCNGRIGFVNCIEPQGETEEDKLITVRGELEKLNAMGVNITIAITRSSSNLIWLLRKAQLVDLIIESDGGFWTKYGWEPLGNSRTPSATLVSFGSDGILEESEEDKPASANVRGKRSENATKPSYGGQEERSDEIFLGADIDSMDCNKADCAFGNLVADAIAYYARWHLTNQQSQWSRYQITFFHADFVKVKLRRGYMSLRDFKNAFYIINEPLCVYQRHGARVVRILKRFSGSFHMPKMQLSGMYIWSMANYYGNLISVRDPSSRGYYYTRLKSLRKYCVIGPQSTLKKTFIFSFLRKCRPIGTTVLTALEYYASEKRDIYPQADRRYWTLSERQFQSLKSGLRVDDTDSVGRRVRENKALSEKYNLLILYSNNSQFSADLENITHGYEDIIHHQETALYFRVSPNGYINSVLIRRARIIDFFNSRRDISNISSSNSSTFNLFHLVTDPKYFIILIHAISPDEGDTDNIRVYSEVFTLPHYKIGVINCLAFRSKTTKLNQSSEAIQGEALKLKGLESDIVIAIGNHDVANDVDEIDLVFDRKGNVRSRDSKNIQLIKDVGYDLPTNLRLVEVKFEPVPIKYIKSSLPESSDLQQRSSGRGKTKTMEEEEIEVLAKLDDDCAKEECSFGNMIADAMVFYGKMNLTMLDMNKWSNFPMAMYMDQIKRSIRKGNVTVGDFNETVINKDRVVQVHIFGWEIEDALTDYFDNRNTIIQVSGIRVTSIAGSDLFIITVMCGRCKIPRYHLLDTEVGYEVLMNERLANELGAKRISDTPAVDIIDIVQQYVYARKTILPTVEDRYEEDGDERILSKLDFIIKRGNRRSRAASRFTCFFLAPITTVVMYTVL
ncbi:hypothetical protein Trydic_g14562 [Trypoxylus dichotomus]